MAALLTPTTVKLRFAAPDEGPLIHTLLLASGKPNIEGVDWTQSIGAHWLLACAPDPVGCICIQPGLPIARMEILCVDPLLPKRLRARVARDLCYFAMNIAESLGAQCISSVVNVDTSPGWAKVVERRGAVPWDRGMLYLKRL